MFERTTVCLNRCQHDLPVGLEAVIKLGKFPAILFDQFKRAGAING